MNRWLRSSIAAIAICAFLVHLAGAQQPPASTSGDDSLESDVPPKLIRWSDLAPKNGKPFNDPFAKLTNNQIVDLSYVMRVRRLIADNKISKDGVDAIEAAELTSVLESQGVDTNWIMLQHGRVQQIRSLQVGQIAESVGKSLQEKNITLTGYAIPTKVDEGDVREFLLVPTIAACSHEDPPPRLQVVTVSVEDGMTRPSRQTPVSVTGKIKARTTTRTLINANGQIRVYSAYAMDSARIDPSQTRQRATAQQKRSY